MFTTAGFRNQTNANLGPSSLMVRALGQDAVLDGAYGKRPDWNFFQTLTANYAYKIGTRGDAIEASFLGINSRQYKLNQFNLGLVELVGRSAHRDRPERIVQDLRHRRPGVAWETPIISQPAAAASPRARRSAISALLEAYLEQRHRDFSDSTNFPTASQQTGRPSIGGSDLGLGFGPLHWTARAGYEQNRADLRLLLLQALLDRHGILRMSLPCRCSARHISS